MDPLGPVSARNMFGKQKVMAEFLQVAGVISYFLMVSWNVADAYFPLVEKRARVVGDPAAIVLSGDDVLSGTNDGFL